MESLLLDAAGHRRSPATMPGYELKLLDNDVRKVLDGEIGNLRPRRLRRRLLLAPTREDQSNGEGGLVFHRRSLSPR